MGIPKLTNFVNEHYHWRSVRVQPGSKIVIDGYSLCYPLYSRRHEWQFGGDYREFYHTVKEYFQSLKLLKIDPCVVIDGVDYDGVKLDTTRQRFKQKLNTMKTKQESVLPLFAKSVFVDVLRDMDVTFYVANGEADQDVVSLANFYECPVLGKDSDYFIFNIEHGYIPVCDVNGYLVDLRGKVRCFWYEDFVHQFYFCDPDLRLYIPVFLGNDFRNGYSSSRLAIDSTMPINEIIKRIAGIVEENKCDMQAFQLKEMVSVFYRIPSRSYPFLAGSRFLCEKKNPDIPQWVLDLYKRGQFIQDLMCLLCSPRKTWEYSVVIEDVNKASAWEIVKNLKRYIVGLLLPRSRVDLCIVDRYDCSLSNAVLPWSPKYDSIVQGTLADMPHLSESDRRDILLTTLNCKKGKRTLNSDIIPDGLKLVVIASRRWLKEIKKDEHAHDLLLAYVNSLVCCILSCYFSSAPSVRATPAIGVNHFDIVHIFAQWQCVLHHVVALNQVLCLPYQYTSVAKLFSGSLLHHYLQNPQLVEEKMDTLPNAKDMFAIITRNIFSVSPPEADNNY